MAFSWDIAGEIIGGLFLIGFGILLIYVDDTGGALLIFAIPIIAIGLTAIYSGIKDATMKEPTTYYNY